MKSSHGPIGTIVENLIRGFCPLLTAACVFLFATDGLRGEEPPVLEIVIPDSASEHGAKAIRDRAIGLLTEIVHALNEVPEFIHLLNDTKAKIFSTSMQLLAAKGLEAHPVAPHVKEAALSPTLPVKLRFQAAFVLLSITPEDEPVVGEILAAPNTPLAGGEAYYALGFYLAKAMYETGHTSAEVPGVCKVALGDYDKPARLVALNTLENLGPEAAAAAPLLWSALEDDDEMVQACAATAIFAIDENANADLARRLADRLDWSGEKRKQLVDAANKIAAMRMKERDDMRRLGAEIVPECVAMLRFGREAQRRTAMRWLARLGAPARAAVPYLRDCAANAKEAATRELAKSTLKKIGPNGSPAP